LTVLQEVGPIFDKTGSAGGGKSPVGDCSPLSKHPKNSNLEHRTKMLQQPVLSKIAKTSGNSWRSPEELDGLTSHWNDIGRWPNIII
jgi:hypothetical protein